MADSKDVLLWESEAPKQNYMWDFITTINNKYDQDLKTYQDLHQWSIENISDFWAETWHFTGIIGTPFKQAVDAGAPMFPRPNFFEGARLNFAENLLYPKSNPDPKSPAIISVTESSTKEITWQELRDQVQKMAAAMKAYGLQPHDRVAGFLGNHSDTVVAMLAATSLGAIWTGISADTGVALVVEKLSQIKPVILFADNAVTSHGKVHESVTKTREIVKLLPTLKTVVIFETVGGLAVDTASISTQNCQAFSYNDFLTSASKELNYIDFEKFPPEHPTYILYSSGTTGKPKCIVHSAAGTLVQHKKEHVLHCNIRPGDRLFYVTTCSWMMWHWLVAGLSSGATIVMFQGNPFKPDGDLSMPKLIERMKITQFGTSAKYLSILEQNNCQPLKFGVDLSSLRAIYSTGSPLAPSTFKYVYDAFPKTINLGSITGGTDIISLFGAPSPLSPVYQGEIQVKGLGMDIAAVDGDGKVLSDGETGDLVCLKPFPCQPVGFWASDEDEKGHIEEYTGHKGRVIKYNNKRYFGSYFEKVPGAWHHGDFVYFNPRTGGLVMLGRSDGVLNRSGVRFGSSEIYNILLREFPNQVEDALCIGRRRKQDTDEAVILFLKMKSAVPFDENFKSDVKRQIGHFLSRSHIPDIIDECFEIPKTSNDKKSVTLQMCLKLIEVVVKQILSGENVKTSASVANPECLEWYREWSKSH